jgi:ankyrin repeat protein
VSGHNRNSTPPAATMPQAARATARLLAGLLLLAAQAAATHPSRHAPRTMIADTLTPLHAAARNGQLERVRELVQLGLRRCDEARLPYLERQACYKGGTVDSLGDSGWAPMHEAAMHGHTEVITYLLEQNADVNVRSALGSTPLHWAARGGHADAARVLIDAGGDVDATNYDGKSVLDWAPQQHKSKVLQAWGLGGLDLSG